MGDIEGGQSSMAVDRVLDIVSQDDGDAAAALSSLLDGKLVDIYGLQLDQPLAS